MSIASYMTHWYLHLPSLLLAVLIYLLLGRLVLSFALDAGSPPVRVLGALTHPVVVAVGAITPRMVPLSGVIVCAILWLIAARVAAFWIALAMGMRL